MAMENATANNMENVSAVAKDKTNQNQVSMLGVYACFIALDLFITIFLTARLFDVANIAAVAFFYVVLYTCIFIFFCLFSYIVKRHSRVRVIRVSMFLYVCVICLVMLLQDNIAETYLVLAVLDGIAQGMFWCAIHALSGQVLGGARMKSFQSNYQILSSAARIVFPITLGALISFASFEIATIVCIGVGVCLFIFTLFLCEPPSNKVHLSMSRYFTMIKKEKLFKPVRDNFIIQLFYGIFGLALLGTTLLIVMVFNNDFKLGVFNTLFAAISIVIISVYKILKNGKVKNSILFFSCAVSLILSFGLLLKIDATTIILFQAGFMSLSCIPKLESDTLRLNAMKYLNKPETIIESNMLSEFAYFIARLIVLGCFMLVYYLNELLILQVLMVVLMAIMLFTSYLINRWYNNYNKEKIKNV